MTAEPNKDIDINEHLFKEAIENLKQAVSYQSTSQRRVSKRVKILIRSVMIGMASTLIFIFYLVYILTQQVEALSTSLDAISEETSGMLNSIEQIEIVMMTFDAHMNVLPAINQSITEIDDNLYSLTGNMSGVTNNVSQVTSELRSLRGVLASMSNKVDVLDNTLLQINKDVNDVSKPLKRFNDFNPFNHLP
jgi:archaellum component FlaC